MHGFWAVYDLVEYLVVREELARKLI